VYTAWFQIGLFVPCKNQIYSERESLGVCEGIIGCRELRSSVINKKTGATFSRGSASWHDRCGNITGQDLSIT